MTKRKFPWEADEPQPRKKQRRHTTNGIAINKCENCDAICPTFKTFFPQWKKNEEFSKILNVCENCDMLYVLYGNVIVSSWLYSSAGRLA